VNWRDQLKNELRGPLGSVGRWAQGTPVSGLVPERLRQAYLRFQIQVIDGWIPQNLGPEDALVLTQTNNHAQTIEAFIDHHLALGARGIVVFDHGSQDETVQLALRVAPVLVLQSTLNLSNQTVEALLQDRFAQTCWGLNLRPQERFEYPGSDVISLGRRARYLNGHPQDYESFCAQHERERKVFCIGFHKTGTTSMGTLLRDLGYRCVSAYRTRDRGFVQDLAEGRLEALFRIADRANGFEDNPWPLYFKELQARYPGSQFILTTRDPDAWARSVANHFGNQDEPDSAMRRLIYGQDAGDPTGQTERYRARLLAHNEAVRTHFGDSPDLLEVDVSQADVLQRICDFLGHDTDLKAMPHANRRLT
jgi:hypothetical protein